MDPIRHQCPDCQAVSLSPHVSLKHGSSAIWTCEECGSTFDIRTSFVPIAPETLDFVRPPYDLELAAEGKAADDSAEAMQKLVETLGEILFLRDRLLGLEEEAQRLREDLGDALE